MEIKGKVQEEWRDVKGFENIYQVSNLGSVKSLPRTCRANTCGIRNIKEKLLSMCKSKNGYFTVVLCKNGKHKSISVHRLVAETFINNPHNKKEVNHKDENKLNNHIDNLEWCDRTYNANYGTGIKRCAAKKFKKIVMIDRFTNNAIKIFDSGINAEKETGIDRKYISYACIRNKIVAGYKWKFLKDIAV